MSLDRAICALADGNRDAFDEIYETTSKTVYYLALSVVKERSLAEDVMQTVYLSVLRNAATYQAGTNPRAWIARMTQNAALDMYRRRTREFAYTELEYMQEPEAAPDEYGVLVDMARKLLPSDEFSILMLVTADGYKRREIAELFDMPISTVTWKYNNAIQTMRAALAAT